MEQFLKFPVQASVKDFAGTGRDGNSNGAVERNRKHAFPLFANKTEVVEGAGSLINTILVLVCGSGSSGPTCSPRQLRATSLLMKLIIADEDPGDTGTSTDAMTMSDWLQEKN